jgi:hypothetical protein
MKGIGYFQNLRNFSEFFWIFLGIFWEFFRRIFLEEFFWKNFFGEFFWKDFFGRIFLGGFFLEDFFWRIFFGGFFWRMLAGFKGP